MKILEMKHHANWSIGTKVREKTHILGERLERKSYNDATYSKGSHTHPAKTWLEFSNYPSL